MNKVLVTGLGIATAFGACDACNLNFTSLIRNPSTLLWADKICVPKDTFDLGVRKDKNKLDKVIQMFLNMTDEKNIIDKINISEMYQENMGERIYNQAIADSHKLMELYPHSVKKGDDRVPDEVLIEGEGFCGSWMASIYASLLVAHDLDANCLFGNREHIFLKYLYSLTEIAQYKYKGMESNAYNEIFSLYLPETVAAHNYVTEDDERCHTCAHIKSCENDYLKDTEAAFQKILEWREYDEIYQAKEVVEKLVKTKDEISSENDIQDLIREFKAKQENVNQNINKRFPKVERWTKMTTVLASPFIMAGAVTDNKAMTIGGACLVTASEAMEKVLEYYKSKNNWVGFINNLK